MKKATKFLTIPLMALVFGFISCESKTAENVENSAESAVDELGAEADSAFTSTDTISVRDQPVDDGVADKTTN